MKYSFIHKIVVPNTILIVDDDEMNRDVLGNIFSASHSIEMAENGKECLNKILEYRQKFCAILLDVVMPVMGGIEVLKKLNRDGVVDHIPVFLITGETDTRIIKRAYELGVMDVISKPISSYIVQRRGSGQRHGRGRRRPVHLCLPGRGRPQHPRLPQALPRNAGYPA